MDTTAYDIATVGNADVPSTATEPACVDEPLSACHVREGTTSNAAASGIGKRSPDSTRQPASCRRESNSTRKRHVDHGDVESDIALPGIPQEKTGLSSSPERLMVQAQRPLSMAWIPERLLSETIEVWSGVYRRRVSEDEAVEILMNVKHLGEALLRARKEMKTE